MTFQRWQAKAQEPALERPALECSLYSPVALRSGGVPCTVTLQGRVFGGRFCPPCLQRRLSCPRPACSPQPSTEPSPVPTPLAPLRERGAGAASPTRAVVAPGTDGGARPRPNDTGR